MLTPSPLPRNLEASFRDLGSERAAVRASAIRDVVRHAGRSDATRARAIPELERALRDDRAAEVRAAAAVALADLVASEALATLLVAAEDDDAHVRQMALAAVGEIGDPRAKQRLERAVRDARPEVRYQAVIAFPRVAKDDPASVASVLSAALADKDPSVQYIAMRMAEESGVDGTPLRDEALSARASEVMNDDGPAAVVAALYLARQGDTAARAVVVDVVAGRRRTPEAEDEQACVEIAGELQWEESAPALERRAWGTPKILRAVLGWGDADRARCAWHARTALARMGHARAKSEILADLASWSRDTREAAVVAAGRARIGEARAALERLGGSVDATLVREALVHLAG